MITSKYTIREKNEAIVLQHIIEHKEISRSSLAIITKLNKATISSIINKLLDNEFIMETRIGDSTKAGGRKPIYLKLNKESSLVLSIDIGIDYIEACLSYVDGTYIRTTRQSNIPIINTSIISSLKEITDELIDCAPKTKHGILGLAIAVHGIVQHNNIHYTPNYSLDKINLKKKMEELYNFPVYIENEANLTALGNYSFTSGINNLISISIHSGIGTGIIKDGNLLTGKSGIAGEIGHAILFPNGIKCPCGNNGCLEQYASTTALYKLIATKTKRSSIDTNTIIQLAKEKNHDIIQSLEENAAFLAIGINNIVMMYDPEAVIINNPIYFNNPDLIKYIKKHLNSRFTSTLQLITSPLASNATLLGGISLVVQNHFKIQKLKFIQ